jgi:hypothetical protein
MLHLLFLPFTLLFWLLSLPFRIVFWVLGTTIGLVALLFHIAIWVACIGLALLIGRSRGLNPLLCLILGALGPVGLLIVVALALIRPARYV